MSRKAITSIGVVVLLVGAGILVATGEYLGLFLLVVGWVFGFACGEEAEEMKANK